MKNLLLFLVLALLLTSVSFAQTGSQPIPQTPPVLTITVNVDTLRMGPVCPGYPIESQVRIRNFSSVSVKITRLETDDSEHFTSELIGASTIGTGAYRDVNVTFFAEEPGIFIAKTDIFVEGQSSPAGTIMMKAVIKSSKLEFIGSGSFNNVKPGQRDTIDVKLVNNGNDYAYLENFIPFSNPFKMLEINPPLPQRLDPGEEIDVKVEYSYNSLYIDNNILKIKSIPRSGQCLDSAVMQLFGQGETFVVGLEPEVLDYGIIPRCETVYDTLKVTNLEGGDFEILRQAEIIGAEKAFFEVVQQPVTPILLKRNEFTEYVVAFRNIDDSRQRRQAVLRLKTNDPKVDIIDIPLMGTHEGLIVDHPATIDFKEVLPYHPRQEKFIFTNNGTIDLHLVEARSSLAYVDVNPQSATIEAGQSIEFTIDMVITNAIEIDGLITLIFDEPCIDSSLVRVIGKGFQGRIEHPENIDYGNVPYCEARTQEIIVNSTGNTSVSIKEMYISGRDEQAFTFSDDYTFPFELAPGGHIGRNVVFDASDMEDGLKEGEMIMVVEISGKDSIFTVPLEGIRISPQLDMPVSVGFEDILAGDSRKQIITIVNETGLPITINRTFPLKESVYSYTPALSNFLLEDNGRIDITINFSPDGHRDYFDTLRFETMLGQCLSMHQILIQGNGILESTVSTIDTTGAVGSDNLQLPLFAKITKGNLDKSNLSFDVVISFEAELFYPKSVKGAYITSNEVIGSRRYLGLHGDGVDMTKNKNEIAFISGVLLLSQISESVIKIEEFEWSDDIFVNKIDGKLEVKKICQHNLRPIISFLPTEAKISPMPVRDNANINIRTQEQGDFTIELYATNSELVTSKSWVNKSSKIETFDFNINTSALANGVYFLVIQTPMGPKSYPVLILKD